MKTGLTFSCALVLFCFTRLCSAQYQNVIRVGVILEGMDPTLPAILDKTVHMLNRKRLTTNQPQIVYHYQNVSHYDSFSASEKVCRMLEDDKVIGIIGPESFSVSFYMDSMSSFLLIPLIKSVPEYRMPLMDPEVEESQSSQMPARPRRSVNLYPHPRAIGQAIAEYIMDRKWIKDLILIYENEEALFRLQDVLTLHMIQVQTQLLDPSGDYKPQLKNIKETQATRILLDCSIENTISFLTQALEVKMMNDHYDYIIANWDFYAIDTRKFQNTFVNITGIQLVDTNMTDYSEVKKQLHSIDSYMNTFLPFGVKTEHALFHDAVLAFSKAVDILVKNEDSSSASLYNPSLSCNSHAIKFHGEKLIDALHQLGSIDRRGNAEDVDGLTGKIKFDEEGYRVDYKLFILKFTKDGFLPLSEWSERSGFRNLYSEWEMQLQSEDILHNRTLRVSSVKNTPFLIVKDNADELVGNDKIDGYVKDFVFSMSKVLNVSFLITPVKDEKYGNKLLDGTWNGMVGEVLRQEADVVVADLTMTQSRQEAVDFTTPFMNLGIGILFKRPAKAETSLFSFLDPFHSEVWIYMGTAYLGVSIVLFFLSRLSPNEWDSSHPCDEEPEELETQFNLLNCFWFTIGSLMQQGCDFLPKAISTRVVASVWWFFTLIFVSSYTANLAAFLTASRMQLPINSAKDLASQQKIKYGCVSGGSTQSFFKNSNSPVFKHMWSVMSEAEPSVFVESNNQGLDRVRKGDYAFFMENILIQYEVERDCELMSIGQPLDNKGYGIAVKKGSQWLAKYNHAVLKMQEDGILNELKKKWWTRPPEEGSCESEKDSDGASDAKLGIENVGGVFVLLIVGMVIACIVGVGEFLWHMHKVSVEENVSLKEEIKHEMKFIMNCGSSTKPVSKSEAENGNGNGNEMPLHEFEET